MAKTVAVLGGGVAGMSAAQELAERGFKVEVYERQLLAGGKARSIPVLPEAGDHGGKRKQTEAIEVWKRERGQLHRLWIPGEHGFRFFPSFYRHVINTMDRIPLGGNGKVSDNLVDTTQMLLAQYNRPGIVMPSAFPRSPGQWNATVNDFVALLAGEIGVSPSDMGFFASRVWQIITSCYERRLKEYEKISWWEFIDASNRSKQYQKFFCHGILRSLVAAQAEKGNARTLGDILIQLILGVVDPATPTADRLLCGPTNETWIIPWLKYLRSLGVEYHFESTVIAIHCKDGTIRGATVQKEKAGTQEVKADYYVAAVPVERIAPLVTSAMLEADPHLAGIRSLAEDVQWMNGIQFYLRRDVPIVHGHAIYTDSAWALTSVSQRQFWQNFNWTDYGDGLVRGILSVDISDWETPGLNGKPAKECTRREIAQEVWNQLKLSLNTGGRAMLRDEDLHYWFLDPDIQENVGKRQMQDAEPLLVNYVDSWRLRPEAVTAIPNLFLASDYIRTFTDLATMEGANEAARRAVNGILDACGSNAERCRIWNLNEPAIFQPFREYDRMRFNAGLPWDDRMTKAAVAVMDVVSNVSESQVPSGGFTGGATKTVNMDGLNVMTIAQQIVSLATGSSGPNAVAPSPRDQGRRTSGLRIVQKK